MLHCVQSYSSLLPTFHFLKKKRKKNRHKNKSLAILCHLNWRWDRGLQKCHSLLIREHGTGYLMFRSEEDCDSCLIFCVSPFFLFIFPLLFLSCEMTLRKRGPSSFSPPLASSFPFIFFLRSLQSTPWS